MQLKQKSVFNISWLTLRPILEDAVILLYHLAHKIADCKANVFSCSPM